MFSKKQKFPAGKVAIAFGVGAAAGSVLALLFTPLSGKKMQKKIVKVTENVVDTVEDKIDDVQATVRRIARA
jgi:gas vesicle protein